MTRRADCHFLRSENEPELSNSGKQKAMRRFGFLGLESEVQHSVMEDSRGKTEKPVFSNFNPIRGSTTNRLVIPNVSKVRICTFFSNSKGKVLFSTMGLEIKCS